MDFFLFMTHDFEYRLGPLCVKADPAIFNASRIKLTAKIISTGKIWHMSTFNLITMYRCFPIDKC